MNVRIKKKMTCQSSQWLIFCLNNMVNVQSFILLMSAKSGMSVKGPLSSESKVSAKARVGTTALTLKRLPCAYCGQSGQFNSS